MIHTILITTGLKTIIEIMINKISKINYFNNKILFSSLIISKN